MLSCKFLNRITNLKAVVIEFYWGSPSKDWVIVTNNSHGNTVKSSFLAYAGEGWTCDVRGVNFGLIFGEYDYVSKLQEIPYDIVICSWRVDSYFYRHLDKIVTELAIPVFMPSSALAFNPQTHYTGYGIIFVGSSTTYPSGRLETWDTASNLTGPDTDYTSYTTAVVAGKSTVLVEAGFTGFEVKRAVQEQSSQYPTWDSQNGYGEAPALYTPTLIAPPVPPEPEPIIIPAPKFGNPFIM
jgi:hypothetical protein